MTNAPFRNFIMKCDQILCISDYYISLPCTGREDFDTFKSHFLKTLVFDLRGMAGCAITPRSSRLMVACCGSSGVQLRDTVISWRSLLSAHSNRFIPSSAGPKMLNEVLEALKVNVRVEALYIQNFESGFYNEQLALLTEVLKLKRIWWAPVPVASPRRCLEFVSRPPSLRHPRCGTGASMSVRTSAPRCRLGSAFARSCRRQQLPTCVPTPSQSC